MLYLHVTGQGLNSVPYPMRVSLAEPCISISPSGNSWVVLCLGPGNGQCEVRRGQRRALDTHRQMIFSVRTARFPTPSLSLRFSCSANHTSERSGVRSHAVSPSLLRSSGLAPRDRNNLRSGGSEIGQQGAGARGWGGRGLQHTVVVALPGSDVQGRVPVVVNGVQVTLGVQEDLGNGGTAREGGPV